MPILNDGTEITDQEVLDAGCGWEFDPYNGDGDCSHGYDWPCDDCPINVDNRAYERKIQKHSTA